jgi:hypothetical protein
MVSTDGMVVHDGRLFMPSSALAWPQVLAHVHGVSYEGVQKTLQHLCTSFSTPRDNRLVCKYIKGCSVCQCNKTEHLHPAGLLQPLLVHSSVWTDIAMDFVEGFPKVGGKSVILTVVDRFSKFAHFISLGHPYSAASVAKAFFNNIVRLHGFSASIVSDRDPVFTNHSGLSYFTSPEHDCAPAPPFTPRPTVNRKLLIRSSLSI